MKRKDVTVANIVEQYIAMVVFSFMDATINHTEVHG